MTEDNKYTLDDMVMATVDQKPLDFETAFNDIIVDKIRNGIENRKIEIAQQMYNYEPPVENDDEFGGDDSELDNSEEE
jgi:hypothetical protein